MTEATPEMALRIEADVRLRAGQITETQARGIVRAGKVDPLATMVAQQSLQAHGMAAAPAPTSPPAKRSTPTCGQLPRWTTATSPSRCPNRRTAPACRACAAAVRW